MISSAQNYALPACFREVMPKNPMSPVVSETRCLSFTISYSFTIHLVSEKVPLCNCGFNLVVKSLPIFQFLQLENA